ncbi:Transcriptional regulator, LysR family [hydrothermal vent metagenome]|uniref:Transcriptional regulator, LysR family n=1 Tax=hydrothermal vent metagenome TaxID=652676 RepID=A0A3B0YQM5_9ZZZZ
MMDLDSLRSFIVFAEHLNFTRAAESLYLSQPALHTKIKKFSDSLGVRLYERQGKNLILTTSGLSVLQFGRQLIESTENFQATLTGGKPQASISLAAGEGTYLYFLGPIIQEFRRVSTAGLTLITAPSQEVIKEVMNGSAHLGITAATAYPEELRVTKLIKVPMVLIIPAKHLLATRTSIRIKHLQGLELIVPTVDRPHRQLIDRHTQAENISWNIAVEANGWELILHFVKLKLGNAIVNGSCSVPKGFVAIPFSDLPSTQYHLLHRPGADKTEERNILIQIIRKHFTT